LLFPVIVITGNSDVNEINDLAISACIGTRETLHLVFWGAENVQLGLSRDQAGPAGIKSGRPGHGGWSGEIPRFFGHLALAEGATPSFSIPCVQIAIVCVHLAAFTKSIVRSKHYMFYLWVKFGRFYGCLVFLVLLIMETLLRCACAYSWPCVKCLIQLRLSSKQGQQGHAVP
jgi:hypothetical protein